MKNTRTALLPAMTIVYVFTIGALLSCDEMGLDEDGGPAVSENALESTCVCRVDGDISASGDGKTWETAKKTAEECVAVLEKDASASESCEIWLKEGTVDDTYHLDSSRLEPVSISSKIAALGGFKGMERFRADRMAQYNLNRSRPGIIHASSEEQSVTVMPGFIPDTRHLLDDLPMPQLLSACSCNTFSSDVGIGNATPGYDLEIDEDEGDAIIDLEANPINYNDGYNPFIKFRMDSNSVRGYAGFEGVAGGTFTGSLEDSFIFGTTTNDPVQFAQNNSVKMTITGGKVGIGTTSPGSLLSVVGGTGVVGVNIKGAEVSPADDDAPLKIQEMDEENMWIGGNELDTDQAFYINFNKSDQDILLLANDNRTGNVGIGTTTPNYLLDVDGTIRAEELRIEEVDPADFVFSEQYALMSLEDVDKFISEYGHLPGVRSGADMQSSGISVSQTTMTLLQKIEELTLYAIEQEKRIKRLEEELGRRNGTGDRPESH